MSRRVWPIAASLWLGMLASLPAVYARGEPAAGESTQLGQTQLRSGEYREALQQFDADIARIEAEGGQWDERLVEPLVGRGDALYGLGDYGGALAAYSRAQHIVRVNEGLYSLAQVDILERKAEASAALNDWQSASDQQQYALRLAIRAHGEDGVALLPALERMGRWYRRTGNVYAARSIYQRAIEILEAAYGPDDVRLVGPLTRFASTFRAERYPGQSTRPSEPINVGYGDPVVRYGNEPPPGLINRYAMGEAALRRARDIYAKQRPDDIDGRIRTLLELGDWFVVFDKWTRAEEQYQAALALRNERAPDSPPILERPEPLFLLIDPLPKPVVGSREARRGHIEVRFRVTRHGQVRDVEVVDAEPPGVMDLRIKRAMKTARFRPRFEAGRAVEADDVTYRHEFTYYAAAEGKEEEHAESQSVSG